MCDSVTGYLTGGLIDPSTPDYAGQAQQQEAAKQQRIQQGISSINNAFAGYDKSFYNKRVQAYEDYALPQLSQQYNTLKNQIGFGLANKGLTASSTKNQQFSNLNQQMGMQKQAIADTGRSQAQALQQQINAQKNTLYGNLYQSSDPAGAKTAATNTAAGFQTPQTYVPIANMFNNLINQYYTSQLLNANKPTSYISGTPNYGTGGSAGALPPVEGGV